MRGGARGGRGGGRKRPAGDDGGEGFCIGAGGADAVGGESESDEDDDPFHLAEKWYPGGGTAGYAAYARYMRSLRDDEFVIDPLAHGGSVAHLFNHSCEPNCCVIPVYKGAGADARMPEFAFFSTRTVQAGEELSWAYAPIGVRTGARRALGAPAQRPRSHPRHLPRPAVGLAQAIHQRAL
jgi:hypothetical protein